MGHMLGDGARGLIHDAGDVRGACRFQAVQRVVDQCPPADRRQGFGCFLTQALAPACGYDPSLHDATFLRWSTSWSKSSRLLITRSTLEASGGTKSLSPPISQKVFIPSALAGRMSRSKESPTKV